MTVRRSAALFLCALLLAARPALAQRYAVENLDIDATVREDGALDVREILTYDFRGAFTFAFRDIPRKPMTRIEAIAVTEDGREYVSSNSTEPGHFSVAERGTSTRITWRYRAKDEQRTFTLSYRITGQIQKFPDTAELYYKFVGEDWDRPIGNVTATVRFPQPVPESALRAWAHGPLQGSVRLATGRVDFDVSPLPARRFWEGRILFPPDVVPRLALSSRDPRAAVVLAEERRWAEEANQRREALRRRSEADAARQARQARLEVPFVLTSIALAVAAMIVFFRLYERHGRPYEVTVHSAPGDPPSAHPPALVGYLMNRTVGPPAIVATLLDLARRGYLTVRETEDVSDGRPTTGSNERRGRSPSFARTSATSSSSCCGKRAATTASRCRASIARRRNAPANSTSGSRHGCLRPRKPDGRSSSSNRRRPRPWASIFWLARASRSPGWCSAGYPDLVPACRRSSSASSS